MTGSVSGGAGRLSQGDAFHCYPNARAGGGLPQLGIDYKHHAVFGVLRQGGRHKQVVASPLIGSLKADEGRIVDFELHRCRLPIEATATQHGLDYDGLNVLDEGHRDGRERAAGPAEVALAAILCLLWRVVAKEVLEGGGFAHVEEIGFITEINGQAPRGAGELGTEPR